MEERSTDTCFVFDLCINKFRSRFRESTDLIFFVFSAKKISSN